MYAVHILARFHKWCIDYRVSVYHVCGDTGYNCSHIGILLKLAKEAMNRSIRAGMVDGAKLSQPFS